MERRKFAKIMGAAVAGMMAGCHKPAVGDKAATTQPVSSTPSTPPEPHICKSFNSCKGQGNCSSGDAGCAGKNSCKGKGGCASAELKHGCAGQNACKGKGGCAAPPNKNGCAGRNDCKGL